MYAIIEMSGKQYRVKQGDDVVVDRLDLEEGKSLTIAPMLIGGEQQAITAAELKGAKVKVKVAEHMLGKKVRVFTYKPKSGYKKMKGHRSRLSRITVESIAAGAKKKSDGAAEEEKVNHGS